ncbi:MAG: iron ABC transporter permease [Candidatus Bathyarchaeia archaeon]
MKTPSSPFSFLDRFRRIFSLPLIIVLVVSVIILLPALSIFYNSFTSLGFGKKVGFTLLNYANAFSDPELGELFINSLIYSVGSSLFSISVAIILAWIVTRTDAPMKSFLELIPVIPLIFPPILKNIGWIYILSPRAGILNNFLSEIFRTKITFFNAFSMPAMIWTFGLSEIPTAYLLILPAFLMMDPSLEEAAYISGANTAQTFLKVTLPLALPSILSAFILLVIHGFGAFETAVLQGIPGGIYVFISKIYDAYEHRLNPGLATAYASILIVMMIFLVSIYVLFTRRAEKFATIIGKGYSPRVIQLGKWRYVAAVFIISYFLVAIILPYGVTAIVSILPYFTYSVFKNFIKYATLNNFSRVLNHPTFLRGIMNSLMLGLAAGAITIPVCAVMSYVIHRGSGSKVKKVFEFVGTLPSAFPGMLMALGLLWIYFGTPLYGSLMGILVAYLIFYTPYGLRALSAAIIRIHKELEEAAFVHGASWGKTFLEITIPLLKVAMASGFFYIFIQVQRRLGEVVLLAGPGVEVAPTVVFDYFNVGQWGEAAAASLIYASLLLCYIIIAKYLLKVKFRI